MNHLELATEAELIRELFSRFDHVVFGGLRKLGSEDRIVSRAQGGRIETLGLTMHLAKNIDERHEDGIRDEQEGEW